jgi:hypothetical protein
MSQSSPFLLLNNPYWNALPQEDTIFNNYSVDVNEVPLDVEKVLEPYKSDDSNFSKIESDINNLRGKLSGIDENIKNLSKSIDYDPIEKARKEYREMYKWKDASKKRKLGSIGLGILDTLLAVNSGRGLRARREEEELQRYKLLQDRANNQINLERQRENSLNNLFGRLSSEYEKARVNKEKNELLFKAKEEANRIQDVNVKNKFITEVAKLAAQGELNAVKIEKIKNELNRPKNIVDFAALLSEKKVPMEAKDIAKELFEATQRDTPLKYQLKTSPVESRLVYNPETKDVEVRREQAQKIFNNLTGQLEDLYTPSGVYLPAAEITKVQEMKAADNLFRMGAANALSDLASGRITDYTGLKNTELGRRFSSFINADPNIAMARSLGWQTPSFASLMHVKGIYGGRAPQALINDLELILEGKGGATPEQYASALLTQAILTRSNLLERANYLPLKSVYGDSNFYNYVKARMSHLVSKAKNKEAIGNLPYLEDLIQEYLNYKSIRKTTPAGNKYQESLQKAKELLRGGK